LWASFIVPYIYKSVANFKIIKVTYKSFLIMLSSFSLFISLDIFGVAHILVISISLARVILTGRERGNLRWSLFASLM
jgi:hypothetical protein